MNTSATCPICASKKMYYAFSVQQSRLVECRDCGHMMLHPQPDDEELGRIYNESYWLQDGSDEERAHFTQLKQATARLYLDLIGQCLGRHGGRLLEVGSGAGDMLAAALELGYDVTGIEYSSHACVRARERLGGAGRLVCGNIDDLAERNYFDVCVMADVIEHVRDPRAFLNQVYEVLRPGGIVVVATPSLDSWSSRLMRNKWMEFKTEHLHYFNQETLHSLMFQTGLEPIAALPGRKCLSLDYIVDHFRKYRVPTVSVALEGLSAVVPASLRKAPFEVVASGITSIGVKVSKAARRKLSIIVPAYNEAATIEPVIQSVIDKQLEGLDKEIVIVESNSTDGTREIVLKYQSIPGVKVVLEDRPRGKGHAVRAGLAQATGDFLVIQDGDQEYDIEDYDVLIEPLASGRKAFILGSRHGGRTWKVRQFKGKPLTSGFLNFGHWLFKVMVNGALGLSLDDPFTMYKLFRRDCLAGLKFQANRFDFDYELLIKIVRKGYRPAEIPVNYRSRTFAEGKKVSVVRDPWTWVRAIFKFRSEKLNLLDSWRASKAPGVPESAPGAAVGAVRTSPGL